MWQQPPSLLIFPHTGDFVCWREATLLFRPLTSLRCWKISLSRIRCAVATFCFTFRWWISQFLMIQISDGWLWPWLSPTWLSSRARLWSPAHGQADPLGGEVLIGWESGQIGMELSDKEGDTNTLTHAHTHTHRVPKDQTNKPEHTHKTTGNTYDSVLWKDKHRHVQTHHKQGFMSLHIWNLAHTQTQTDTHTHTHTCKLIIWEQLCVGGLWASEHLL